MNFRVCFPDISVDVYFDAAERAAREFEAAQDDDGMSLWSGIEHVLTYASLLRSDGLSVGELRIVHEATARRACEALQSFVNCACLDLVSDRGKERWRLWESIYAGAVARLATLEGQESLFGEAS